MSDRSNAQIIAEARRQIAKYDDWHLTRPWIEELQGQIAYSIASDVVTALRAVVAALEAEGRLTPEGGEHHVTLDYIDAQRARGWPDMHPEDFCHRCGNRNLSWWVDGASWAAVMRPDGSGEGWGGIICPVCFAELFEARFPRTSWRLSVDTNTAGGRAWLEAESRLTTPDSKPLSKVESTDEREALATLIRDSAAWKFGAPDELADAILARYAVTPRKEQS